MPSVDLALSEVRGAVRIGTGWRSGSRGDINTAANYSLNEVVNDVIHECGGDVVIEVLPGTYYTDGHCDISRPGIDLRFSRRSTIIPRHSGTYGVARVTSDDCAVRGGKILLDRWVNDQKALAFEGGKSVLCERVKIQVDAATGNTNSNPMRGVHFTDCVEFDLVDSFCAPAKGVIPFGASGGVGIKFRGNRVSFELNEGYGGSNPIPPTRRLCYIGFDVQGTRWGTVSGSRVHGVGNTLLGERLLAAIRVLGNANEEGGHIILSTPQIEGVSCETMLLLAGVEWVDVLSPFCGSSDGGIYKDGEAAIKVTSLDGGAGTKRSIRVHVQGGNCHNTGRDKTSADILATDAATGSTTVSAAASDNSFNTTGSWTATPSAGDYVEASGFAASGGANNGTWKVVSATSQKIVVSGGTLVDEAAGGARTLKTYTPFDSAAIHAEYVDDFSVDGTSITDQAHKWGVRLVTTTIRGVSVRARFQKNSAPGGFAPILMPEGALPTAGSGNQQLEGVAIQACALANWASTPLVAHGENKSGVIAQTAANVTGAKYFPEGLMDASTGDEKTSGTTMANLSPHARLS